MAAAAAAAVQHSARKRGKRARIGCPPRPSSWKALEEGTSLLGEVLWHRLRPPSAEEEAGRSRTMTRVEAEGQLPWARC